MAGRADRVGAAWRRSAPGRIWRQGTDMELMHRSMGFAALGVVTLMPLLIVVAAAVPYQRAGFAQWIVDGMGLSAGPAATVRRLFSTPGKVLSTTSALSLAALAVFGLSFAASVATGYERVWDLPAIPWHAVWRRAVWLAVLTGYLFVEAQSGTVLDGGALPSALRIAFTLTCGVLFFWWGQRFLLGNRVPWRPALTGAVCTMAGLVGLRVFSVLVLSPLTLTSAVTYGPVGTVLMVQSWLIGVGFVIFGGALVGRQLHHRGPPEGPREAPPVPRQGRADGPAPRCSGHRPAARDC
ncbi:ribonuclease BN [Streptomyces cocklensis]|uniref:Membrane protein n=1 Tax=Actinacidiphila cocklensis TaxID=887465 RepID=A0A9W4E106_9ACTN|nr:ribonuclease BN [Actinacidiphila cocklensis]MDD1058842.1 ribonuclease BN [Actinacidiphila cocklensis]CAG6398972.1 Membrane protein [Actinacidiphila cocklensis]